MSRIVFYFCGNGGRRGGVEFFGSFGRGGGSEVFGFFFFFDIFSKKVDLW